MDTTFKNCGFFIIHKFSVTDLSTIDKLYVELASELESDLWDTVAWHRKWLVDFNAGKTQLVSFDHSDNIGAIDVKMDGSAVKEKSSFKRLGLTLSSKLDWGSYIISIAKATSKKILQKNIQFMLEFLKAQFWVQHFCYFTSMTFLIMLSVILLSILLILLPTLNVIKHLIFGLQQLDLASELESDLQDTGLGQEVACWF